MPNGVSTDTLLSPLTRLDTYVARQWTKSGFLYVLTYTPFESTARYRAFSDSDFERFAERVSMLLRQRAAVRKAKQAKRQVAA